MNEHYDELVVDCDAIRVPVMPLLETTWPGHRASRNELEDCRCWIADSREHFNDSMFKTTSAPCDGLTANLSYLRAICTLALDNAWFVLSELELNLNTDWEHGSNLRDVHLAIACHLVRTSLLSYYDHYEG